jgi:hypothetical protein
MYRTAQEMSDLQRTIVQNLLPYAGAGKMK